MNQNKFWKPGNSPEKKSNKFNLDSLFSKFKKPNNNSIPKTTNPLQKSPSKYKGLYKGLGIGGLVFLIVLAIVGGLSFFLIIKPSYEVMAQVNLVKQDKIDLETAFTNQDIDGINAALEKLTIDLNNLKIVRDENFGWTKSFGMTKDYYSDSEHFIDAGLYTVDALKEFVVVVQPFADAAGFKSQQDIQVQDPASGSGFAEAFAGWVKVMPQVANGMDGVIAKFDRVGAELEAVDPNRYPEYFRGTPVRGTILTLRSTFAKTSEYGPDIKEALIVIPQMLGVGEEKRYAIIMQNDAEIRATGGFWTNYATFKVKDAMLNSDFTSKDMYSIDQIISTTDTAATSPWPKPIGPYAQFLKTEHQYARDANVSPDYPTSIDAWMWYYKQAGIINPYEAKPINGVVAIDTHVVRELLNVTGPVTLNGTSYDGDNAVLELERIASLSLREQADRKKVLGDLMEEMLMKMYQSESNLWPRFIQTGIKLANEKHILGYVFDNPSGQQLLEKYNFAGRIIQTEDGDYSYVVSTNLAGDKNNIFVTKSADHRITQEGGKWVHEVTLNYTFGEPKPGYEPLVTTYRDWIRVFAPAGSKLLSVEGSDATTNMDTGEERGRVYFAGHITLAPQEQKTIKFKYELPENVVKDGSYKVYLQKQPGTVADKHTVSFNNRVETVELLTDKIVEIPAN